MKIPKRLSGVLSLVLVGACFGLGTCKQAYGKPPDQATQGELVSLLHDITIPVMELEQVQFSKAVKLIENNVFYVTTQIPWHKIEFAIDGIDDERYPLITLKAKKMSALEAILSIERQAGVRVSASKDQVRFEPRK